MGINEAAFRRERDDAHDETASDESITRLMREDSPLCLYPFLPLLTSRNVIFRTSEIARQFTTLINKQDELSMSRVTAAIAFAPRGEALQTLRAARLENYASCSRRISAYY